MAARACHSSPSLPDTTVKVVLAMAVLKAFSASAVLTERLPSSSIEDSHSGQSMTASSYSPGSVGISFALMKSALRRNTARPECIFTQLPTGTFSCPSSLGALASPPGAPVLLSTAPSAMPVAAATDPAASPVAAASQGFTSRPTRRQLMPHLRVFARLCTSEDRGNATDSPFAEARSTTGVQ